MTKATKILNDHELKAVMMLDDFNFNGFYKEELNRMITILKQENRQLKQLNKIVYIDKSKKILDELEKWLEYRFTPNHTLRVDEVLNKLKKLKGE